MVAVTTEQEAGMKSAASYICWCCKTLFAKLLNLGGVFYSPCCASRNWEAK